MEIKQNEDGSIVVDCEQRQLIITEEKKHQVAEDLRAAANQLAILSTLHKEERITAEIKNGRIYFKGDDAKTILDKHLLPKNKLFLGDENELLIVDENMYNAVYAIKNALRFCPCVTVKHDWLRDSIRKNQKFITKYISNGHYRDMYVDSEADETRIGLL